MKPSLIVSDEDANSFVILGYAGRAWRSHREAQGVDRAQAKAEWDGILADATDGDRDHLMMVLREKFDVRGGGEVA